MKYPKTILASALLVATVGGVALFPLQSMASPPVPGAAPAVAPPVKIATVAVKAMPIELRTFGTVEPVATVAVKSQITGLLTNVLFQEGQEVRKGDLLFMIDSRGSEAALQQAEASLAKDKAQLHNAEKESERQDELLKKGITAEDARDQARTSVEMLRAQVQSDQAAVASAALQVEYCHIGAPVDGKTGNLLVHAGNLVKADDTTLVTLNQIKPILVRFSIPQQQLAFVREKMAAGVLQVLVSVPGSVSRTVTGAVTFIDNTVDSDSGTILVKARFENGDTELWPGQFVNVTARLAVETGALVVPARAVLPGQNGSYVYVIAPDGTVSNRSVQVDRTVQDDAVIARGVGAGERVVTDGQLRLAPGVRVTIQADPSSASTDRP